MDLKEIVEKVTANMSGGKIRRKCWKINNFHLITDHHGFIKSIDRELWRASYDDFLADDWELYEEKECEKECLACRRAGVAHHIIAKHLREYHCTCKDKEERSKDDEE